jgi:hypothetical protein
MSRVYFHTEQRTAQLRGSERGWLGQLASKPAADAWNLNGPDQLARCEAILALIPEPLPGRYGANYLHQYLREAQAWEQQPPRSMLSVNTPLRQLISALETQLNHSHDLTFHVAGHNLGGLNVKLNTALADDSEAVAFAAKVDGWCEIHAWIDGPDRKWAADLIDDALRNDVYRAGLWYAPSGAVTTTSDRVWCPQGWDDVTALLRETDDGPVVMSYSVCDSFPNHDIAAWTPTIDAAWTPSWATDDEGREEWDELTDGERAEYRNEHASEQWSELPADVQWQLAMDGLRADKSWARIGPDTLRQVTFHVGITVYDLLASDRGERVRAAFSTEEA